VSDTETEARLTAILNSILDESERHTQQVRAYVQHFQEVYLGMGGNVTPPITSKRLGVGWIGQNTTAASDNWSNSDCGCACVAMWLNFMGLQKTVDDVSAATGLARGYSYTLPAHLIKAAQYYGLGLERVVNLTIDAIKAEVLRAVPVIVLVHYGALQKRADQNFTAGHWILVVGCDADKVYYHDPYWADRASGSYIEITNAQLETAMQQCALDGNTPKQGLRSKAH
jgi:hypothetical protein